MKHYSFNLKQFNNRKEKIFEISSRIINVACEDDIINEIVDLIFECYNTNLQLKKNRLSSSNVPLIRLSYPIILIIKDVEHCFEIMIILKKFKETLEKNSKSDLFEIIKNQIGNTNDIKNIKQKSTIDIVFSDNNLIYDNDDFSNVNIIDYFLTDFEVFSICRGLEAKYFQHLSRQFFNGFKLTESELT